MISGSLILFDIWQTIASWLAAHGVRVFVILAVALFFDYFIKSSFAKNGFGLLMNQKIKNRLVSQIGEEQKKRMLTIAGAVSGTVAFLIYIIAILTILPEFGLDITPIIAGLGVVGLAFSMAAREILTDFLAGFFIILDDEFNIGDKIEVGAVSGRVEAITFRRTMVRSDDGRVHYIRNNEIKIVSRAV